MPVSYGIVLGAVFGLFVLPCGERHDGRLLFLLMTCGFRSWSVVQKSLERSVFVLVVVCCVREGKKRGIYSQSSRIHVA